MPGHLEVGLEVEVGQRGPWVPFAWEMEMGKHLWP